MSQHIKRRPLMNKKQFVYDCSVLNRQKQVETMLLMIHKKFCDEIAKNWIVVKSEENNKTHLTEITILISDVFNQKGLNYIDEILDLINTVSFYAIEDKVRGAEFEAMK
jgi:hypothetical protein